MAYKKADKIMALQSQSEFKQSQTYSLIKQDILNNTYPPGTIMVERKLCDIYSVSRSPIRNALQQLSHEGLLSFVPGKGVVVPEFTIEDILEVYDLIEILQTFSVSSCISKLSDIILETFQDIINKMKNACDNENLALFAEWDQRFHMFIINVAGSKRLITMFENLNNQSMRFQASTLEDIDLAKRSYEEHINIFQAISQKDSVSAKKALSDHYHNIKQYYINMLLSR